MVDVSRHSKRVYITNSLYGAWDDQFNPDGVGAWMAKLDVADGGGISFDERFFLHGDAFRRRRPHQIGLQGATPQATPTAIRPTSRPADHDGTRVTLSLYVLPL
jgi:hypothetical protein